MKYKLYLKLVSEDGLRTLERVMIVDEKTIGRQISLEAIEEMYDTLNKEEIHPTPLEVDLSPDDEVYKPSN